MTEAETARELYDRVRRDSGYGLAPYRVIQFIAQMMRRDPFEVLHAVGFERVAADDAAALSDTKSDTKDFSGIADGR